MLAYIFLLHGSFSSRYNMLKHNFRQNFTLQSPGVTLKRRPSSILSTLVSAMYLRKFGQNPHAGSEDIVWERNSTKADAEGFPAKAICSSPTHFGCGDITYLEYSTSSKKYVSSVVHGMM